MDTKLVFVQSQAETVAVHLEEAFRVLTVENVQSVMVQQDLAGMAGFTHVIVTDGYGYVLYDPTESFNEAFFYSEDLRRALVGFERVYARFSGGSFYSGAFTPVMSAPGVVIGVVFVHNEDPEQGAILMDMQNTLQNISIIVAVFSVAMVAFLIWSVMRRIRSVLNAIKSVREGEYNYRISMSGSDELAVLGDEFNSLTDRLRETDEIRRRFVADASHELKTPLASIRLLSDSILQNEDMEHETVLEFISDIGMEAVRLARTTEKLMTLTRLDSDVLNEYRGVDVRAVVISTLRILQPLARSRGIELDSELGENLFVFATEDSIHQVVFNLVENAIKYNKPDGLVSIRLHDEGEEVILTVDDTGVGVPEADLPYIFDRFYRVDKARSREVGGSGLGLSIVWDTVRELNGKVSALPRPYGGMSFQVRFAKYSPKEQSEG